MSMCFGQKAFQQIKTIPPVFAAVIVVLTMTACVSNDNASSVRAFFIKGEREVVTCFENTGDCYYWDDGARKQVTIRDGRAIRK